MASDTLGAVGEKPHDHLCVPPEFGAGMTARVCLIETLAVGATPVALMALTCNEYDPTGARLLAGIQAEIAGAGFVDLPIAGSSENNMPTSMTALGITLLGECERLVWRQAQPGDGVYLVGLPYVGAEVAAHCPALLTPLRTREIRSLPVVGDVLPCGSRGIEWELQVLAHEIGYPIRKASEITPALLTKSAGPAICALATSSEPFMVDDMPIMQLGTVSEVAI